MSRYYIGIDPGVSNGGMVKGETWHFTVYGPPIAWARPRAVRVAKGIRFFEADHVTIWRNTVAMASLEYKPNKPSLAPLRMQVDFSFIKPKTLPKKVQYHTKKPDCSNLVKAIEDCLEGIYYHSDAQIVRLEVTKVYGDAAFAMIRIEELTT